MEGINYFFKGEKMVVTASVNLFEDNICKPIGNIKVYLNIFSSNNKISDSLEMTKGVDNIFTIEFDTNKYVGKNFVSCTVEENGDKVYTNQKTMIEIKESWQADIR